MKKNEFVFEEHGTLLLARTNTIPILDLKIRQYLKKLKKTCNRYRISLKKKTVKKGLELNGKKTKVMVVNRNNVCLQIIFINGNKLRQRDQVKHLETLYQITTSKLHLNSASKKRVFRE